MKSASPKSWIISSALLAFLVAAPAAKADMLLFAQSVTGTPGEVNGLFTVSLTNQGAAPVDVEAFTFEINTMSANITFEQATTGTTLNPYIFAGNSLFGPVISTSSPGQTLDASDVAATTNSFTVVNPGASFGLGLVEFNVAPGAPNQVAPVTFNMNNAFTSVSDQNGILQPLQFAAGSITVTGVSPVPEPAPGVLLLASLTGLIWRKRFRAQQ